MRISIFLIISSLILAFVSVPLNGNPATLSSKYYDKAIINPAPDLGEAPISSRVILTCSRLDFEVLCRLVRASEYPRYVWQCPLREGHWKGQGVTIVGPVIGGPYAVMVMEKLIALGAKMVLLLGRCGSLHSKVRIGDMVLPTAAVSKQGTLTYYASSFYLPRPHQALCGLLKTYLKAGRITWHQGYVWTTDAIYRETIGRVRHYQEEGMLGVEMEAAHLFTVGHFRKVPVAGLLVVSDELFTLKWQPGFHTSRFRRARQLAAHLVLDVAAAWK